MTGGTTDRHPWRARYTALLFMAGSLCFAAAAVPGLSVVLPPVVVASVFVVGSLFFTAAAALQWTASSPPWGIDWWASAIQFAGTLWFNVNTILAVNTQLTARQEDLRVWTPDMIGSACFLVSSALALWVVRREPGAERSAAWFNLVGSLLFGVAAVTAFVRPATDDALGAGIANSGTLLGALCFLCGARLVLPPRRSAPGDADRSSDTEHTDERPR